MKSNTLEAIIGALVLSIALGFFSYAYSKSQWRVSKGYTLYAKFDKVDGLVIGSDVKISGIKVGAITGETLDPKTYQAVLTLDLDPQVKLPTDTSAEVASDGLLGGKHLRLVPGSEEALLKPQEEITYTQSSVSLESLLGQMIFNQKSSGDQKSSNAASSKVPDAPHP